MSVTCISRTILPHVLNIEGDLTFIFFEEFCADTRFVLPFEFVVFLGILAADRSKL
jgi:hypothetical protein